MIGLVTLDEEQENRKVELLNLRHIVNAGSQSLDESHSNPSESNPLELKDTYRISSLPVPIVNGYRMQNIMQEKVRCLTWFHKL